MSESLRAQATDLAGSMTGDAMNIKDAVSEAITNSDARQSALTEIMASLKSMWNKITESGILGAIVEKIKGLIASFTGGSGDEGSPLLEGGAGGLLGKLGSFVPDGVKSQLPEGVTKMLDSDSVEETVADVAATTTAVATPDV